MDYTYDQIAGMIDHSLLNPALTDELLEEGCRLALRYAVASVCVKPCFLRRSALLLEGSKVKPTTTIGFPHGGHSTAIKVAESKEALRDGAQELDVVVNIGKVLSADWSFVRNDIEAVVQAGHDGKALVKVIFENCYLRNEHKIMLCQICGEVGADFVKTSTGYAATGATREDIQLMRAHSPTHVQIKAAHGIRTLDALLEMRSLGVTRVGATATASMLNDCRHRLGLVGLA